MPAGYSVVNLGKQLEWLTGGYLKANFHEVVHTDATEAARVKAEQEGRSVWRVASTMFCAVEGSMSLRTLDPFRTEESEKIYPDVTADEQIRREFGSYQL